MHKKIILYFFVLGILGAIFAPAMALAASCPASEKGEVTVITRDSDDDLLKNIKWDLIKQLYDADNNHIKGSVVGSSNTGEAGMSSIKFDPLAAVCSGNGCDNTFVVRIYDINRDAGEYMYWENVVNCGDSITVNARLSSIKFTIRNKDKNALKNRVFELYTQKKDAGDKPIIDEAVSKSLNTGDVGIKNVFVAPGYYIIKIPAIDNKFIYTHPDLQVSGSAETEFDYTLSNVTVSIRDGLGKLIVSTPFNVFKQEKDADGNFIIGEAVGAYNTGSDGVMGIFLPTGNYALRFNGSGGEFYYLWNQQIIETKSYTIDYRLSNINVIVRDSRGELLVKSNFDVYKQALYADGKFIVGEHIGRFSTGDSGVGGIFLPSGNYAFRFEGTATQYQFLWDQFIGISGTQTINFKLGTFKTVITGAGGELLKNIQVTLYKESYDEFQKPILGAKITTLNTGDGGAAAFYVPLGKYVVVIKSPDGKDFTLWSKEVFDSGFTQIDYVLSSIDLVLRNGNNEIIKNSIVEIYEQSYDAKKIVLLGKLVGSKNTGNTGRVTFYYPAGNYAIKIKGTSGKDYYLWEKKIKEQKTTRINYFSSMLRIIVRDSGKNPVKGAKVAVSSQKTDFAGKSIIDKSITSIITLDSGYVDVFLPSGKYAVSIGTEKKLDIRVLDYLMTTVEIEKIDTNAYTIKTVRVPAAIGYRKDSTLMRVSDNPAVYVIKNGEKRVITSAELFQLLGYVWKNVIYVSQIEMEIYNEGEPMTFEDARRPDGTLIKTKTSRGVYLIDKGKKRQFASAQVFDALGYKWSRILTISDAEFAFYPVGDPVTFDKIKDGNLVKIASSPAIYIIENGLKRLITSERIFRAKGYKWSNVMVVAEANLAEFPDGEALVFHLTDEDQDGLNYEEEILFSTDPSFDDTDHDGYLDGEEVRNGFNPLGEGKLL